mmetsp:Transcript_38735/g.91058  ORF Transcript_38735/g.91058 Transcript_38735/m.91058 type:complete len:237 (+) Transcript_38735:988-1698(+)
MTVMSTVSAGLACCGLAESSGFSSSSSSTSSSSASSAETSCTGCKSPPPKSPGRDMLRNAPNTLSAASCSTAHASSNESSWIVSLKGFSQVVPLAFIAAEMQDAQRAGSAKGASLCSSCGMGKASCCTLFLDRLANVDSVFLPLASCSSRSSSLSSWFISRSAATSNNRSISSGNSAIGTVRSPVAFCNGYIVFTVTLDWASLCARNSTTILYSWSVRMRLPLTYSSKIKWKDDSP